MKHGILSLLHLTKIYKRLLVVLPPVMPADESLGFFLFSSMGQKESGEFQRKGFVRSRKVGIL